MQVFKTEQFYWNADAKTLSCDASDLGFRAGELPMERIFNDAADAGVAVRNPTTGRICIYSFVRQLKNSENEVTEWQFEAMRYSFGMPFTQREYATDVDGLKLSIFND